MSELKSFKTLAKEAKLRFKKGYWKEYDENKESTVARAKEKGYSEDEANKIYIQQVKRDIKVKFDNKTEDDILYEKVFEILSSDEVITNPIKRLVDDIVFNSLLESEKQTYILKLTNKFNELKLRYEKEQMLG